MMTLLRLTVFLHQNLEANAAKHRELFDLIKAGDPIAAEAELASHLEGSRQRMVTVWEQALERRRIKS
jgi:DNA-binding FadR family transcriptional regulator